MALIIDETFQTNPGYDETWEGPDEVQDGVANEDYTSSNLTGGTPSNFGTLCFFGDVSAADGYARFYDTSTSWGDPQYWQLVIFAEDISSISSGEAVTIVRTYTSTWGDCFSLNIYNDAGTYKFQLIGVDETELSSAISTQTSYVVDIEYDNGNNALNWKLDNVAQNNVTFTTDATVDIAYVGVAYTEDACEIALGHLKIDDTDYVTYPGNGGGVVPQAAAYYRRMRDYKQDETSGLWLPTM
jgi:hypothetical protein